MLLLLTIFLLVLGGFMTFGASQTLLNVAYDPEANIVSRIFTIIFGYPLLISGIFVIIVGFILLLVYIRKRIKRKQVLKD